MNQVHPVRCMLYEVIFKLFLKIVSIKGLQNKGVKRAINIGIPDIVRTLFIKNTTRYASCPGFAW